MENNQFSVKFSQSRRGTVPIILSHLGNRQKSGNDVCITQRKDNFDVLTKYIITHNFSNELMIPECH